MARSRNIKPGFFKNEHLGEADPNYSLLFAGLWVLADREGRLENRPKRIKAEIFPYRDVDVCTALAWLEHESFITVYEMDGSSFIQINNWRKHQSPHHKEVDSVIPPPPNGEKSPAKHSLTHAQPMHDSCMDQPRPKQNGSCPTDSFNLIPLTLNPITTGVEPPVATLPAKGNETYYLPPEMLADLERVYHRVSVVEQLERMALWLHSNPGKRKTSRGMPRFINTWLSREDRRAELRGTQESSTRKRSLRDDLTDTSWVN